MWPKTFAARLADWHTLRERCKDNSLDQCITAIDEWWQRSPWCPYHLHWDDIAAWPDPWQLLDDNIYCDLARALGILYTITMIDRDDLQDALVTEINGQTVAYSVSANRFLTDPGQLEQ